jgi:hypothetical protein
MSNATDYLENKLADWLFRGQAFTPPATLYIAAFTVAPTDTGGGTEVSGGGYARQAIASSLANWSGTQGAGTTVASTGTGGQISNNVLVDFGTASAGYGTVTAFGVFDASTAGNMILFSPLSTSKAVNTGDRLTIPIGSQTWTVA